MRKILALPFCRHGMGFGKRIGWCGEGSMGRAGGGVYAEEDGVRGGGEDGLWGGCRWLRVRKLWSWVCTV